MSDLKLYIYVAVLIVSFSITLYIDVIVANDTNYSVVLMAGMIIGEIFSKDNNSQDGTGHPKYNQPTTI